MAMNQLDTTGVTIPEVAAAEIVPGTFAFNGTIAKWYQTGGKEGGNIPAGELCHPVVAGANIWIVKANASDVFAAGGDVFGDVTAQNALTVGGDGQLGYVAQASANGDERVLVRWNSL